LFVFIFLLLLMYSTLGNLVCIDMCFIKNNNKRNVQDTPIKKKKQGSWVIYEIYSQ